MSLPSFPSTSPTPVPSSPNVPGPGRGGAGDHLPTSMLVLCGACTFVGECNQAGRAGGNVWALETGEWRSRPATALSIVSIVLQLKNYRMPALQRCVVRIMVM